MNLSIRPATVDDLPAVDALAHKAVGSPQPQARHLSPQSERIVLTAESNGQVVGMINVGPPSSQVPGFDERGRPVDFSKAPWWKIYALATNQPRAGVATTLLRAVQQELPRRMRGLYGNVRADRGPALAFYRSNGFYLAPSLDIEGPAGRPTLMIENPGEFYFVTPRQRLFQNPEQWEEGLADQLMLDQIKMFSRTKQRSDVGYRAWLRSVAHAPAACGHDELGPRPLTTYGFDPDERTWCTSCQERAIDTIAQHPLMDETEGVCDVCKQPDPKTEHGWAYDESRRLLGIAYLCTACRSRA